MKKAKKRPDFAQNTIHPSQGIPLPAVDGISHGCAVPFPLISESKAIMSETETVSFFIIARPIESKLSRAGYYEKTPHFRAAFILLCIARRGRDSNPRSLAAQQFSRLP